jgi:hypothetical protein
VLRVADFGKKDGRGHLGQTAAKAEEQSTRDVHWTVLASNDVEDTQANILP